MRHPFSCSRFASRCIGCGRTGGCGADVGTVQFAAKRGSGRGADVEVEVDVPESETELG